MPKMPYPKNAIIFETQIKEIKQINSKKHAPIFS